MNCPQMITPILIGVTGSTLVAWVIWCRCNDLRYFQQRGYDPAWATEATMQAEGYPRREPHESDNFRVYFNDDAGAQVKGFPSKGGVYTLTCSPMELDFLGLNRFEPAPRSSDPAEEDAFCAKLRLLAPKWWPNLYAQHKALCDKLELDAVCSAYRADEKVRFVGVVPPRGGGGGGGGVWALETTQEDCGKRGLGRINNAVDMAEKCREIERFGGTFYADPADCPLLDVKLPFPERADTHILVVDDIPVNQKIARKYLEKLGFTQVTAVGDGKQALDYLLKTAGEGPEKKKVDVIIMDTKMPVLDGFECTRILRHEPLYREFAHIPVVGSSHFCGQRDRELCLHDRKICLEAGMDDYIVRPFDLKKLEDVMVWWSTRRAGELRSTPERSTEDAEYDAMEREAADWASEQMTQPGP